MNGWMKGVILGLVLGAGAAHAQVYYDFYGFSSSNGTWHYHETRAKTEVVNGLLRMTRNPISLYRLQVLQCTKDVPAPGYYQEDGLVVDGNDIFTVMGVVRAPHGVFSDSKKAYRIGVGFLDYFTSQMGIFVQDSILGRKIVVLHAGNILKTVPLPANANRTWLKATYKAASKTMVFWWAPFSLEGASPSWSRVVTLQIPDSHMWNGDLYLNPGILGLVKGDTCPASWNVGMDSFSYRYVNQ